MSTPVGDAAETADPVVTQSPHGASPHGAYPHPAYAWFVVSILVLASIISYIDRQVVAIVADEMKADLGLGDAQIGLLYGIFAVFYAIAGLPLAYLADRKSRKHIIAAGVFFWSMMTVACGLSRNFWQVLLARIGVGVGEATLLPATNSLVSDYFPRDRIPLALSVFQTGAILGTGLAFVIVGFVLSIVEQRPVPVVPIFGPLAPWQQTFIIVGAPGILIALVMLIIREPIRRVLINPATGNANATFAEIKAFYKRNLWTFMLHHFGFLSFAMMGFAFVFWTVPFFSRVHDVPPATAAQIFGWIFILCAPFGAVWAGLQAGWFNRRGYKDGNIMAGLLGGALGIPLVLLIQIMPTPTLAFILYAPAVFFVNSPFGLAYGALPVITPPQMRAMIAAIYMFVVSVGMMLGPPLAGVFNEQIFTQSDGVRYSLIALTIIFGGLGCLSLWLCRRHYARSMEEADAMEVAGNKAAT
ncbi:MAG: MFS transporter [Gammaproteobacteria bacterium]|nr:MFS transporter [Gammaproteobacteria bacterium]